MEAVVFYMFAGAAVIGGLLLVGLRNPLSGAFALVASLISIAALFALLHAEFVFILQVLVYAGAIMVLVIFTIMLLNLNKDELREAPVSPIRLVITIGLCAACAFGVMEAFSDIPFLQGEMAADFGSIEAVGALMLSDFLYPFEVISLVLLVAVVGVVLLAKKVI